MKGVQCYELFEGIALKNHAFFSFSLGADIRTDRIKVRNQNRQDQGQTPEQTGSGEETEIPEQTGSGEDT